MSQSLEDVFATPIGDMRSIGDNFTTPIGDMADRNQSIGDWEEIYDFADVDIPTPEGGAMEPLDEVSLPSVEDIENAEQLGGARGVVSGVTGLASLPATNHLISKPITNAVTKGAARIAPKMLGKILGGVAGIGTGGLASAGLGIAAGEGLDYLANKYPDQTNAVLDAISNPNKGLPPPTSHSDMVFPFAPDGAEHSIIQNPDDMRQDSSSTGVLATPPNLVR